VVLFSGTAVALATIATLTSGSRVIFRLRRKVREAEQLGQYTLEEKIGEGGMGAVYRARHALLRRPTAIKLLPPDRLGEESVRRFEREVQLTSELTHPNTVEIYDYGRSPDGVFYYVMEYLDGVDLENLVKDDGPQPAGRVVHILAQVCAALGEAHRRGMVHRDIKPGNIILCIRGDVPDVAKVVDFGLVKELDTSASESAHELVSGTPAYLAPESITNPDKLGPASDLYAVGAVGYYLITGQRLFEGKTAVEVCTQHVTAEPVPPSERTDNDVPAELERLLLQCLAKDPDDRPESADVLAASLLAIDCTAGWTADDGKAWWQRFRAGGLVSSSDANATEVSPAERMTMTVDIGARGA
jgi:serine/threonine-protein kinase